MQSASIRLALRQLDTHLPLCPAGKTYLRGAQMAYTSWELANVPISLYQPTCVTSHLFQLASQTR